MKLLFLLLLILASLLFVPIPFKFDIHISIKDYYLKLYGFNIISNKKNIKKNKSKHLKNHPPNNKKNKKSSKQLLQKNFKKINYKELISELYHRKFKPILFFDTSFSYSLNDASKTAVFYGVLNNLNSPIYIILNIIFNTKKFRIKYEPKFKDEYFFEFNNKSIFFLSIAEIIYIIIILLKHMHNCKEVGP